MSTPTFDWGKLVSDTLNTIGTVLSQIVSAISEHADIIGAIVGSIVVALVAFMLLRRVPYINRFVEWLGGIFRF